MSTFSLLSLTLIINIALSGKGYKTKDSTLVKTTEGYVQGVVRDDIIQFVGIPFAKPPVGNLRFEPPEPLDKRPKKDILDATQTTDSVNLCPQVGLRRANESAVDGDEDCLYLSIFIPISKNRKKDKLPVMMFYSGGGFEVGGSSLGVYDPTTWLNNKKANQVIIVQVNYRLGIVIIASYTKDNINTFCT